MTPRPQDRDTAAKDHDIVGEGPKYEPFRDAARSLLDEWVPNGVENYQRWWGAGICGVVREEDGTNRVFVETLGKEKRAFGVNWPVDLVILRATAISLLVYCEAHEPREADAGVTPQPQDRDTAAQDRRDPFADDVLERLVRSNQDYQRAHGHYIVPLAERLLAARADFEELRAWVAEHLNAIDIEDDVDSDIAVPVLSSLDSIVHGSAGCLEESDYTPEQWRVLMLCKEAADGR